jgi:hypothetical protein
VLKSPPGPTPLSCPSFEQLRFLRSSPAFLCTSRKSRRRPAEHRTGTRPRRSRGRLVHSAEVELTPSLKTTPQNDLKIVRRPVWTSHGRRADTQLRTAPMRPAKNTRVCPVRYPETARDEVESREGERPRRTRTATRLTARSRSGRRVESRAAGLRGTAHRRSRLQPWVDAEPSATGKPVMSR